MSAAQPLPANTFAVKETSFSLRYVNKMLPMENLGISVVRVSSQCLEQSILC
jgi:hypothetical protein